MVVFWKIQMTLTKISNIHSLSRFRNMTIPKVCKFSSSVEAKFEDEQSNIQNKNINKMRMSCFVPSLLLKKINAVETITGICIGNCYISWAKMSVSSLSIIEWNAKPLCEKFLKKTNEFNTLQLAYKIRKYLPVSDLYVMETFSIKGKELFEKIAYIHLSSMLIVLLNGLNTDEGAASNVVFQKQIVLNKLHRLISKNERISVAPMVESMLIKNLQDECKGKQKDKPKDVYSNIEINVKYFDMLKNAETAKKEDLSLAFLLTLTFLDVYIYNNVKSWNKIVGKNFKMP